MRLFPPIASTGIPLARFAAAVWLLLALSLPAGAAEPLSAYLVTPNQDLNQARALESEGEYEPALAAYGRAYDDYKRRGEEAGMLACLERMGWIERELALYGQALDRLREAHALGERLHGDAAEIDAGLGDVYMFLGDTKKAREHYQRAIETLADFDFPTVFASPPNKKQLTELFRKTKALLHARTNLGTLHFFAGRPAEALESLESADALISRVWKVVKDPFYGQFVTLDPIFLDGVGYSRTMIGAVLGELGRREEAARHFEAGREAFQEANRPFGLMINQALRAKADLTAPGVEIGPDRVKTFESFMDQAEQFGALDIVWRTGYQLGAVLADRGRSDEAFRVLARAIDALEQTRSRLGEEALKKIFAASVQEVYARMINLCYDTGRLEAGFDYLERAKARAFLDMLADRKIRVKAGVDPKLVERERSLDVRIRVTARRLKTIEGPDRAAVFHDYERLQRERAEVIEAIKAQSLEFVATTSVATVPVKKIMGRLDRRTVLLSYFIDRTRILVWVVAKRGVSASASDMGADALNALISDYRRAVVDRQRATRRMLGEQLVRALIHPIRERLTGERNLIIVPSGSLHYLPFASLPQGPDRFLIQDYVISILPNASSLFFLDKAVTRDGRSLLALGNPDLGDPELSLKYAETEVRTIAGRFERKTVLTGGQASETALKERKLVGTGLIHVAAHGVYDSRQPLKSALMLTGDRKNDGRLETWEIFSLTMNPRLVVLSACESGVGALEGGDEVQGLNRAFLYAGAGGVLASLWSVADKSTYELMEGFYRALAEHPPAEALRQAQIELMATYPEPFFWAAFYLTGSPDR
ncbi:MAG: CHAT domain-containing protein [Proteobacteria bacterium]|nr:CHAT domain-containing protein [Pseudomonadota bacterium]